MSDLSACNLIEKEALAMQFHTSPAAGCQSGQLNHQETVLFWRSFIRGVSGERNVRAETYLANLRQVVLYDSTI